MKDTLSQEYGVTVDAVGAGEHVRIVERGIRTIKERVRGIVNTLPFKLCSMLLLLLVLFCVSRINMVPSKADAIVISPWERFHKRGSWTTLRISRRASGSIVRHTTTTATTL